MAILAIIGSLTILLVGVFSLNKAWGIDRIWLRHPALFGGTFVVTLGLYWLFTSLFITIGTIQSENPLYWMGVFPVALFWLYITFIIDRRDRAKRGVLNR